MKLPARLRRARKAAKLSGSALSLAAGVGRTNVVAIEGGQRIPRLDMIERIANILHVSPAALAFGCDASWEAPASPEMLCAGIADRAKTARMIRGFSQREVDRRSEDGDGIIRAIEAGTMPSIDSAEKVAKALGVSPAWLAYGIGEMDPARRGGRQSRPDASGAPA